MNMSCPFLAGETVAMKMDIYLFEWEFLFCLALLLAPIALALLVIAISIQELKKSLRDSLLEIYRPTTEIKWFDDETNKFLKKELEKVRLAREIKTEPVPPLETTQ